MLFDIRKKSDVLHLLAFMVVLCLPVLVSYNSPTQLEVIKAQGVLKVATRNTPSAYYIEKNEPAGFEYELANAFAQHLGVELELIVPDTIDGLFKALDDRNAHLVAAGLNTSTSRQQRYRFSDPYSQSVSTLVYRVTQGQPAPREIEDLQGEQVLVLKDSIQAEQLSHLQSSQYPELNWQETDELTSTDILDSVFNKETRYTVVDSTIYESQNSYYPGLKAAFTIGKELPLAWPVAPSRDNSLLEALNHFFALPQTKALVERLQQKYFDRRNPLNYFDTVTFKRDFKERLPALEQYFYMAEQETDIDWILLAAIAYQESHWRADAVSPTGVEGIMMLTRAAAQEVGVTDRTDPVQSILGGAEYLVSIQAKIPERIPQPDHTWFALAGYNVGFGHLEDARVLAQRAGDNPDKWDVVKEYLPMLSVAKYYKTLRRGYARGQEPVQYVNNIQKYVELLTWEKKIQRIRKSRETSRQQKKQKAQEKRSFQAYNPLEFDLPSTL